MLEWAVKNGLCMKEKRTKAKNSARVAQPIVKAEEVELSKFASRDSTEKVAVKASYQSVLGTASQPMPSDQSIGAVLIASDPSGAAASDPSDAFASDPSGAIVSGPSGAIASHPSGAIAFDPSVAIASDPSGVVDNSAIEGPTLVGNHGFKCGQETALGDVKAVYEASHVTIMSMEVYCITRHELNPDPEFDPISAGRWD